MRLQAVWAVAKLIGSLCLAWQASLQALADSPRQRTLTVLRREQGRPTERAWAVVALPDWDEKAASSAVSVAMP